MKDIPEKVRSENEKADIRKYAVIAVVTFLTFCCCSLFFFFLYRYHGFAAYWQKLMKILQPVIMGFIVAYLLNPVMMVLEKRLYALLVKKVKEERKARRMARTLGTLGAILFLLLIIFLLLYMMIPELIKSIQNVMVNVPEELNGFTNWMETALAEEGPWSEWMATFGIDLASFADYLESMLSGQILPQVKTYLTYLVSITTGVISAVKMLFNFIIGLVIALYLLMSKETFIGQGKKIVYAVLPVKLGNIVIHVMRVTNQMFGGFISGKILDSAIIGVICYVGLICMQMPYSLLVAVIVGVTNVIPFFGPFIGAVPGVILIALADPIKGLYFLIFVLALQQVDGNIIGPKILGDSTGLSSFWVVFAILVGGGLFGFMGMLLGVPTFAVIYYLLREIVAYVLRRRRLPERTAEYIRMQDVDVETGRLRYKENE